MPVPAGCLGLTYLDDVQDGNLALLAVLGELHRYGGEGFPALG